MENQNYFIGLFLGGSTQQTFKKEILNNIIIIKQYNYIKYFYLYEY